MSKFFLILFTTLSYSETFSRPFNKDLVVKDTLVRRLKNLNIEKQNCPDNAYASYEQAAGAVHADIVDILLYKRLTDRFEQLRTKSKVKAIALSVLETTSSKDANKQATDYAKFSDEINKFKNEFFREGIALDPIDVPDLGISAQVSIERGNTNRPTGWITAKYTLSNVLSDRPIKVYVYRNIFDLPNIVANTNYKTDPLSARTEIFDGILSASRQSEERFSLDERFLAMQNSFPFWVGACSKNEVKP